MSRMPEVGEIVDDVFRIESEIDSGNFGSVYKVQDLIEHRTIALKVLRPGPHDEVELRQRFEREARLVYSLRHPHVIKVYYYGETQSGLPYMAMEFLNGTDLRTLLSHHGALNPSLIRRISHETLSALNSAHEMGIVHRDLKPANIFLVNDGGKGHVKVLDFGFAKALEGEMNAEITTAGTLVGTPAYMAPELVHKKNVGPQADLYAMGLIIAEMVTGKKVIQIESVYDTILAQANDKPVKLDPEVRASYFGDVVVKAVAKSLDKRYKTTREMIDELNALEIPGSRPPAEIETPSEFGTADTEAHTRPRSTGRPSLEEVDQELGDDGDDLVSYPQVSAGAPLYQNHSRLLDDDEPTLNRTITELPLPEHFDPPFDETPALELDYQASYVPPADDGYVLGDHDVAAPRLTAATQPPPRSSGFAEVAIGVIAGVVILAIILGVLTMMD